MSGRCHVADLGPVRVSVVSGYTRLHAYLDGFYPLTPCGGLTAEWTIEARLAVPEPGMALTRCGAGCRADREAKRAVVCSANPRELEVTVREAIGEVLVGYCEAQGSTMLQASAVTDGQRVVIVAGGKGSGKTTLALSAVLADGYQLLSDGHLILYRTVDGLALTSLPALIQVRVGTYLDYARQLGESWDSDSADIEKFRQMPHRERYGSGARLLYTYRSLGQAGPVHTPLCNRDVTVVLAHYAAQGEPAGDPVPAPDRTAELWPYVLFDWVFSPALNTRHLPRASRDHATFVRDTASRLSELGAISRVTRWRHHGHMAPLLSHLASLESPQ